MKRVLLTVLLSFILFGCSDVNNESDSSPILDKEFVEANAEIGHSKDEVEEIFGTEYFSGEGEFETNEVWVYDKVKDDFEYEKSIQIVPFDEIREGNVDYQLYINFVEGETIMYLYIYRGEDGELWQYQVNPDGTTQDRKM
ncbi:PhoU family transcriptional regulator [Solibacillus sp. FSL W8-0474]|uniref:PhoU family transcriptional regulator n=1 Tax=Solibacillus sp. FSL W8-0474 TaxID=2975336 RepID=UPI0030F82ABC